MLIDATHAEETRVVVVDGNKVDEFDFESLNKRQLAGNIYLAKVTRVEPSLQAAFVDYGGNRHGFLAFSEIHPDYYQIPKADREALIAEEAAFAREAEEEAPREKAKPKTRARTRRRSQATAEGLGTDDAVVVSEELPAEILATEDASGGEPPAAETFPGGDSAEEAPLAGFPSIAEAGPFGAEIETRTAWVEATPDQVESNDAGPADLGDAPPPNAASGEVDIQVIAEPEGNPGPALAETPAPAEARAAEEEPEADEYESVGGDDVAEERAPRKQLRHRRYKIQEVIKVRQILLVQVVKEERGNKGAALTTYLSLAGRYCVLMPNTARGGGISRKITNAADRKKLKEISASITVPEGAGLIIRTAGANRTKTEIKRDYEYLLRQWEQIRDLTLKSIAPAPIYEEGSLIKRVIRDLYSRDIEEILVDGERGYREAKDYMKMLMPSHAKNVRHYNEALPLFSRFQVENYLSAMFNPVVQLRSGGYIVIDVTEALVAIDVNSGRATREASIEETALKTNLEAAEEAARQMRLRDLAGLIVIDFIDMEDRRNNASVEKRLKEKLKTDRARIQVGRISGFGLLEMSRQRLRPGMIEATTKPCAHCHGTGRVRSDDSLALALLREIEEEGVKQRSKEVLIVAPVEIANYLLNQKREHVAMIEARFGLSVRVEGDPTLISPDYKIEKLKTASRVIPAPTALTLPPVAYPADVLDEEEEPEIEAEAAETEPRENGEADADRQGKRKRRRRRRGGRNGDEAQQGAPAEHVETVEIATSLPADVMEPVEDGVEGVTAAEPVADAPAQPEPRTRSRRRSRGAAAPAEAPAPVMGLGEVIDLGEGTAPEIVEVPETTAPPAPRKRERVRRPAPTTAPAAVEEVVEASVEVETIETEGEPAPVAAEAAFVEPAAEAEAEPVALEVPEVAPFDAEPSQAEAPAVPDFVPEEGAAPELGGFESPIEAPVVFDAPYEAPYDQLNAETALAESTVAEETAPEPLAPAAEPWTAEPVLENAPEATAELNAVETPAEPDLSEAPAEAQAFEEPAPEAEASREFEPAGAVESDAAPAEPAAPKRRGWWSRD